MRRIVICDDLPEQITALRDTVAAVLAKQAYVLKTYSSVADMLTAFVAEENADVLLLDICMPELDGVSVAHEVNRLSPATQIIFISAHPEYALDVYETEHIYFLKKPVSEAKLGAAFARAFDRIEQTHDARIVLPVKGAARRILRV